VSLSFQPKSKDGKPVTKGGDVVTAKVRIPRIRTACYNVHLLMDTCYCDFCVLPVILKTRQATDPSSKEIPITVKDNGGIPLSLSLSVISYQYFGVCGREN
jgi:hypothetical protein